MNKIPQVNQDICIGCGTCTFLAPKTFRLNGEGKSEVVNPPGDTEEKIQEAIDSCPVQAISWQKKE
ncbi:ferredoxin [Candidatus Shapirobacteria bacterium]|nr:ferredoxin [Candidatus Shapirobacteria bacterium]